MSCAWVQRNGLIGPPYNISTKQLRWHISLRYKKNLWAHVSFQDTCQKILLEPRPSRKLAMLDLLYSFCHFQLSYFNYSYRINQTHLKQGQCNLARYVQDVCNEFPGFKLQEVGVNFPVHRPICPKLHVTHLHAGHSHCTIHWQQEVSLG